MSAESLFSQERAYSEAGFKIDPINAVIRAANSHGTSRVRGEKATTLLTSYKACELVPLWSESTFCGKLQLSSGNITSQSGMAFK